MAHRKKYLISPYNFSLVCVFLVLVLLGNVLMLSFWISKAQGLSLLEAFGLGEAFGFFFALALTLVLAIVFVHNAYEYFGTIEIYRDKVVFRTVFRKKRAFLYLEIKDIGIDYGTISETKQFWIYFGKEKIDKQYTHNILRLPYSGTTMRVQYRKEVYEALLNSISCADIEKRLRRSYSTIRLFHVDVK